MVISGYFQKEGRLTVRTLLCLQKSYFDRKEGVDFPCVLIQSLLDSFYASTQQQARKSCDQEIHQHHHKTSQSPLQDNGCKTTGQRSQDDQLEHQDSSLGSRKAFRDVTLSVASTAISS